MTSSVCPVNRFSSAPVWASYIHTPILLATASLVPSGEYLISWISPFPSRTFAPSGKPHFDESWARMLVVKVSVMQSVITIENNLFFIRMYSFSVAGLNHLGLTQMEKYRPLGRTCEIQPMIQCLKQ